MPEEINTHLPSRQRVVVAMSGGVDSSVAAAEALRDYFGTRKVYIPLRRPTRRVDPDDRDR